MKFTNYLLLERNIINIPFIDAFIKSYIKDIQGNVNVNNSKYIRWAESNLKNYLIREHPTISRVYYIEPGRMQPWMRKAMERGDTLYEVNITGEFFQQIYHVLDYFRANPDLNISRMSVPEAIRQSERWTEELNKKASSAEDKTGLEEVRKYPDGFRWVKVTSAQSLDREGKLMKHCVGSYCNQVSSGSTIIYSLRDKKNEPHCTVEVQSNKVNQIKGKANGPVDNKYIKYVQDFITTPVVGKQYTEVRDLYNTGLIKVDDKYYEPDNLPENLHVKGSLILSRIDIKSLPPNLRVDGDLSILFCRGLTSLPKGLNVGEVLILHGCTSLKTLAPDVRVGRSLVLFGCTGLTSLPEDLIIKGYLDIRDCTSLTSLPKGLYVEGYLDLGGCKSLTSLPKGLYVGRYLDLEGCINLKTLPEDLEVKGNIYVSGKMKRYFKDGKFKDKIK